MISNSVADTASGQVKQWAPFFLKNYSFTKHADITELKIDRQVQEACKTMFEQLWPKALYALKELFEPK